MNVEGSSTSESNFVSPVSTPVGGSESSKCGSESVSEGEEDDSDCLDDLEAIADALAADENLNNRTIVHANPQTYEASSFTKNLELSSIESKTISMVHQVQVNSLAWGPDDVLRPQCLPCLMKQHVNAGFTNKVMNHNWKSIISQPSSCPICCEDLDFTDLRFIPCPCRFLLCLFCHQRILEADAQCPGCRKDYEV